MTAMVRMISESEDGTFNEDTMLWLIGDPPFGWNVERAVCHIFKTRRCVITPKIMDALAKCSWHREAVESICLGTLKRNHER